MTNYRLRYWTPRILGICSVFFVGLFALDAFDGKHPLNVQLLNFGLHIIPSILVAIALYVAWRWEKIGGLIFLGIGSICTPLLFILNYQRNHSVAISVQIVGLITLPLIIIGLLFLSNYYKQKN